MNDAAGSTAELNNVMTNRHTLEELSYAQSPAVGNILDSNTLMHTQTHHLLPKMANNDE